jgi:hypothetical protein
MSSIRLHSIGWRLEILEIFLFWLKFCKKLPILIERRPVWVLLYKIGSACNFFPELCRAFSLFKDNLIYHKKSEFQKISQTIGYQEIGVDSLLTAISGGCERSKGHPLMAWPFDLSQHAGTSNQRSSQPRFTENNKLSAFAQTSPKSLPA